METIIRMSHTRAGRSTLSVKVRNQRRGAWRRWLRFLAVEAKTSMASAPRWGLVRPILIAGLLALIGLVAPAAVHAQTAANVGELQISPAGNPTYVDAITATLYVFNDVGQTIPGTIDFSVDGGPAIAGTLNSEGEAFANLGQLAIGSHTLSATYVANSQYGSATKSITFQIGDAQLMYVGTQGTTLFADGTVSDVEGVAVDAKDNLYVSDKAANVVKEEDTSGNVTTLALTGLKNPVGLALDSAGNLYVADTGNNRIVKYDASGNQTTAPVTGLSGPTYLAYDRTNDILYIVDAGNNGIVSFTPAGGAVASVVTGMTALRGVAVDEAGGLYFSDRNAGFMEYVEPGLTLPIYGPIVEPGGITSFSGNSTIGNYVILSDAAANAVVRYDRGYDQGTSGNQIQINDGGNPAIGMAIDSTGRVYLALGGRVDVIDPGSGRVADTHVATTSQFTFIFQEPKAGVSVTVSPQPASTFSGGGAVTCAGVVGECSVGGSFTPAVPGANTGFFTVATAQNQGKIPLWGKGLGGSAAFTPGLSTHIETGAGSIGGVAFDTSGNQYIADKKNNAVLKITPSGTKTTLAFTGLSGPTQIAVDALGTVFVLDSGNDQIKGLPSAGSQFTAYDGSQNQPSNITAFALDGDDNLVIAGQSTFDNARRGSTSNARPTPKVRPHADGGLYSITLVAADYPPGIGFEYTGYITTSLAGPATGVAVDAEENVYSVDTTGVLTRFGIDGSTTQLAAGLAGPVGVAVDPSSTVYVLGTTSSITVVTPSGKGSIPVNGLYTPAGFALDRYGDILIGDQAGSQLTYLDRTQQNYVFGDVNVGQSETIDGSIGNIGNQPFAIQGPLPANADFVQTTAQTACVAPAGTTAGTTLAPASQCDLGYTFTPPSAGPFSDSGTLVTTPATLVGSSGGGAIALSGTGEGGQSVPQPTLTPATINFGSLTVGATSTAQVATLQNSGAAALTISSFGFFGSNVSSFSQTNNCGASLAAGATCTISIACTPAAAGSLSANLGVNYPSPLPQQSVALSCTGAAQSAPMAALTPSATDFGSQSTGTTSAAKTFTLTNSGNTSLTISGVSLGGSNASDFAIGTNTCTSTLAASASCTIAVTFTPAATGTFNATLTVADNAGGSPQTSTLTGSGAAPSDFTVAASPSAQSVQAGGLIAYTVNVASADGSFTSPVALTATGLPPGATVTFSPASVTPGSSAAESNMVVQTASLQASAKTRWPLGAPIFAALLLLLPGRRWRSGRRFVNLACLVALLGLAGSTIGCGGGFALPSTAKTYTITVTGTSGSDTHSTTVTLTVQ